MFNCRLQVIFANVQTEKVNIRDQDYPTGCQILLAQILYNNLSGKDFGTTCRFKVAYLKGLSELIYLHTIVYILMHSISLIHPFPRLLTH